MNAFTELLIVLLARDAIAAYMVIRGHLTVSARRKPQPRPGSETKP